MAATDFGDHQSEYGDVAYADPKNHKYPINNEERVRAAWSYINMPKNQKGYTPGEIAAIKTKIKTAGKKYGIKFSDGDGDGGGDGNGNRSGGTGDVERRNTLSQVEVRITGGRDSREIGGYAAMFGRPSKTLGRQGPGGGPQQFVEVIERSFFNRSRADGWLGAGTGVVCRYEHDNFHLLGSTRSGTLRLGIDDEGLDYVVDVPRSREDVFESVSRGDVSQSSFAFKVGEQEWALTETGCALRSLHSGLLIDVAPVTVPAYEDTTVGLRSLSVFLKVPEEDVFALAEQHELRKLFIRTDADGGAPKKRTQAQAKLRKMEMLGRRPIDPIDPARRDIV